MAEHKADDAATPGVPSWASVDEQRIRLVYEHYYSGGGAAAKWGAQRPVNQSRERERWELADQLLTETRGIESYRRVVELGCGTGENLARMRRVGAGTTHSAGIDLLSTRIDIARDRHSHMGIQFFHGDAALWNFGAAQFDLVMCFTLFSSILDKSQAAAVAANCERLLESGGSVLWYDLRVNNPFNRQVVGYRRSDLRRLFPGFSLRLRPATLVPPLHRVLGSRSRFLYRGPARRALATHYVGLLTKP